MSVSFSPRALEPASPCSAAKPTSTWPFSRARRALAGRPSVGSSSTVQAAPSFGRLPRRPRRAGSRRRRRPSRPRRRPPRASASRSTSAAVGVCDHLDTCRRGHREVRGEQRHVGAAAARLLGERDAHAAGRAVADEAHGVERLARAARADEHPLARRAARAGASSATRPRRSPRARPSARRPTRPRPARPRPARPARRRARAAVATFACVAGCAHMRRFIAGATSERPAVRERCLGDDVVRDARARASRACSRCSGAIDVEVGALEVRVRVRRRGSRRASARNVSRRDEPLGAARHQRHDVVTRLDEQPRQLARLVGGDPAGNANCRTRPRAALCRHAPDALSWRTGSRATWYEYLILPSAISSMAIVK